MLLKLFIFIAISLSALLAFFAGGWSVLTMLVVIAIITITAAVFFNRKASIYLLIILVPIAKNFEGFEFHTSWATVSDLFPLFPWIVVVSMAWLLIEKAAKIKEQDLSTPLDFFLFFFLFWALISILWAPNLPHSLFQTFLLLINILLFYLIAASLQDESLHRNMVKVLIFWGVVVAALSIISLHYLEETYQGSYELNEIISFSYALKHHATRAMAIANPNSTALFLNLVIAFSFCLFFSLRNNFKRYLLFLALIFLAYGVLETKSKAGVISLILMVFFFHLAIHTVRKNFIRNFLLSFSILASLFIVQNIAIERTARILESQEMSLEARFNLWEKGFAEFMQRAPGWGLSIGGLIYYKDPLPHAHSIYFSTFFDLGLVGFILLLGLMLVLVIKIPRLLRFQETYAQMMLMASTGCFLVIALHGLVDFSYMDPVIWLFLGITIATFKLVEKEIDYTKTSRLP